MHRSPDGSGWVAILEMPRGANGKRRRRKRRANTRAEAQRLLRKMREEFQATGEVASPTRTVAQAVESYLEMRGADGQTAGTRDDDRWLTDLVLDGLGSRRISELTVAQADEFLALCSAGLNGRRSVGRDRMARVRRCLIAVLRNEMRTGTLARNVGELSVLPSQRKSNSEGRERRALTADELRQLLHAATGSRLILIDLCGRNALRPAEARAVRWIDVNLDSGELSIRGQQDRDNNRTTTKRAHNSSRTIRLDRQSVDRLESWREEQDQLRHAAGRAWQEQGLVASTAMGTPIDRHSFARSMRFLSKRLDLDPAITPYELRHTAISLQADTGANGWEVADWAGTSEAMISRVYRHRLRRLSILQPVGDG